MICFSEWSSVCWLETNQNPNFTEMANRFGGRGAAKVKPKKREEEKTETVSERKNVMQCKEEFSYRNPSEM